MGTATFFVDANFGGVLSGTTVGSLTFPAIPALAGHEDLFRFTIDATFLNVKNNIAILNPGDPETTILIRADSLYDIKMAYRATAPHGTDPPFFVDYSIGVVPEPSAGSLLMLGLLCRLVAKRRWL